VLVADGDQRNVELESSGESPAAEARFVRPTARREMSQTGRRVIAAYQIGGGFFALFETLAGAVPQAHTTGQVVLALTAVVLTGAAIVAGVFLWRGARWGAVSSGIVQAIQVPILASSSLVYAVNLGLSLGLSLRAGKLAIQLGLVPAITVGVHPTTYVGQFGINVFALGVAFYLLRARTSPGPLPLQAAA